MSPRKMLWVLMVVAPLPVLAQSTPDLPPVGEMPNPGAAAHAPENRPIYRAPESGQTERQSFLDAQSEMDRRKMLDKQQRTFQLEIDGRYAKALKAYCDTGYGDERCFRPELTKPAPAVVLPAPAPSGGTVSPSQNVAKSHESSPTNRDLPTIIQISGFGDDLSAVLAFAGGKRLRVKGPGPNGPRSQLPDGESVISIRPGEVLVSRPSDPKPISLLFQAVAAYGVSD